MKRVHVVKSARRRLSFKQNRWRKYESL